MECNLTLEQLFELFKDGIKQGEDKQSSYDWGTYCRTQDHEAFKESLIEIMIDRTKYIKWEYYYQAKSELEKYLDSVCFW